MEGRGSIFQIVSSFSYNGSLHFFTVPQESLWFPVAPSPPRDAKCKRIPMNQSQPINIEWDVMMVLNLAHLVNFSALVSSIGSLVIPTLIELLLR